jgi:hypothetical protein
MNQVPTVVPLPEGWAESVARGEADLAAGCVYTIDIDALCHQIEAAGHVDS